VTRKLAHIFTGSSMLTLFYLFPVGHSWAGRLAVALFLVSFVAAFSLAAHIPEEELEKVPSFLQTRLRNLAGMACRSGNREELTKGTLTYAAMTAMLVPLLYTAPINVMALSALYLGDGLADPVGRLLGSTKALQYRVAWFGTKSYPGSLAFFVASALGSLGWCAMFQARGHYAPTSFQPQALRSAVLICSAVATLVEGASPPDVDNVLIPLAVLLTGYYLSGWPQYAFLFHTRG